DGEAEARGEAPEGRVVGVDQLAAPLGDLALVEVTRVREHAAADAIRRLVDGGRDAVVGELERAREARDPGAHDRDARRGARATDPRMPGEPDRQGSGAGAGEEGAAGEARGGGVELPERLRREFAFFRTRAPKPAVSDQPLHRAQDGSTRHHRETTSAP